MGLMTHKKDGERRSLKRTIAFLGFLCMAAAFNTAAFKGRITDAMFITFPLGLLILYAPQLAITLLKIWKGQCVPEASAAGSVEAEKRISGGDI